MGYERCDKCEKLAVWEYMPNDGNVMYCDDCVPRGCSCNVIDWDDPSPDAEQYRDNRGRLLPCCEFGCFEEDAGIDQPTPTDAKENG